MSYRTLLRQTGWVLCAASLVLAAGPLVAQSASSQPCRVDSASSTPIPKLTYDVATIRPNKTGDGNLSFMDRDNGAAIDYTGMTMKNIIENAYGIASFQLSGGPAWLGSDRFDIHARSDDSASAQLRKLPGCAARMAKRQMLQTLLADSIQLATHRGTKEIAAYNLVVIKSGSKLTQSPSSPGDSDAATARRGGDWSTSGGRRGMELKATETSMGDLSYMLTGQLNMPVVDKTALAGIYDFKLQWSAEDAGADATYPSIFTAIQEQLGLKLEPTKAPIETVVVDHVELPSEN